ncbi:acetyltransferase [Thioflavicoccus mobilis 8321]|uniref:Acetyltransferase n=1 Tax=Thioflavicoccus mobilis 8321 TaxID=765912 RepID=L0GZR5_9GAMM|nr:GNAT family N-acetyltransferase [Thioflavicoccus mobilis]AGA92248.1 acetyltransferase [Thioflavicoccus mobilis 8321]
MLPGASNLPNGLGLRPARPSDQPFLAALYSSTRADLRLIDGEQELVESIIDMQFRAQTMGYGQQFPNAMYFIVEKLNERIGKATIDFGSSAVHVVDIAFIPIARGRGYGATVLQAIQQIAGQLKAPMLLSVKKDNLPARRLYQKMGFQLEQSGAAHDQLVWYPDQKAMQEY